MQFSDIDIASKNPLIDQQDRLSLTRSLHPISISALSTAFQIYFDRCHRQPIWLFDPKKSRDYSDVADEVAFAVLALASHFNSDKACYETHLSSARRLVMSQVADGSVRLSTIEALCLISLSCFLAEDLCLGQFHLSLGSQLCQAASMHIATSYKTDSKIKIRKQRVYWSLQILEYYHGRSHSGPDLLDHLVDRCDDLDCDGRQPSGHDPPNIPDEDDRPHDSTDCGVWAVLLQLACLWSRTRTFMGTCVAGEVQEPWRADSSYSKILAEVLTVESRTPMRHRWQNVRFQDQDHEAVRSNSDYLKPWLATQATYRAICTLMNHPFLYMVAARRNKRLAVLNTFWTRSSQLALLHATWIVKIVDIAIDRQLLLSDVIFAQAVAIAATVHLYYLSAANPRLKRKSAVDLAKSKSFLERLSALSPLCAAMDKRLEALLHAALGTNWSNLECNPPTQISLRTGMMWDVLELACSSPSVTPFTVGNGLLHWSLASIVPSLDQNQEEIVFGVGCTGADDSDDVDTPNCGQSAPGRPSTTSPNTIATMRSGPDAVALNRGETLPANSLAADSSGAWMIWNNNDGPVNSLDAFDLHAAALGDTDNTFWWDFSNM